MHTVIAAIDLGPASGRVLYHAAAFARLLSAPLRILHVTPDVSESMRDHVVDFCNRNAPYEIDPSQIEVTVRAGQVSEIIHREARKQAARLVVMGSRAHAGLKKLLLGSTSEAVLGDAAAPVLLVPPNNLDIVSLSDRAVLTCGPVLAAVDLAEDCRHQLDMASMLAAIAGQPLLLMTVASRKIDDHAAAAMLRERGHSLTAARPHSVIVRRGVVADEVARCAHNEGSGLVVMGLRNQRRGKPGVIASAVLKSGKTFVMAVPGC